MVLVSIFLLIGPILVFIAPILASLVFNGWYSLSMDTRGAQALAISGMLGGGGFVGGLWLLSLHKNSN